jgi:glycosyltransferase involved in cell wall biosynthesis
MACGVPVIATNRTSVPEVVGDAALLVDPYSVEAIREAMVNLVTIPSLRADLVAKGFQRVRQFTWERTAELTLKVYESVVAR